MTDAVRRATAGWLSVIWAGERRAVRGASGGPAAGFDCLRRHGTPVPIHGVWIAATAAQRGLRLLAPDVRSLRMPPARKHERGSSRNPSSGVPDAI